MTLKSENMYAHMCLYINTQAYVEMGKKKHSRLLTSVGVGQRVKGRENKEKERAKDKKGELKEKN